MTTPTTTTRVPRGRPPPPSSSSSSPSNTKILNHKTHNNNNNNINGTGSPSSSSTSSSNTRKATTTTPIPRPRPRPRRRSLDVAAVDKSKSSGELPHPSQFRPTSHNNNSNSATRDSGQRIRPAPQLNGFNNNNSDSDGKNSNHEMLEDSASASASALIRELQSEIVRLKEELEKSRSFNLQLQSQNLTLSQHLASLTTYQGKSVSEFQDPNFKPIPDKLEHLLLTKAAISAPSAAPPTPPPPPPPPPPTPGATSTHKRASTVVQLYQSLARRPVNTCSLFPGKSIQSSAHNSIVGEIQNRSSHLLAIKLDIETKGELIQDLIHKVLAAAYTDIEDVVKFVDWLDNQLSLLADEHAVLKHFKWPEKKADALREAAIEYRSLTHLETEVSLYKDDLNVPYAIALKKIASLLDRSERSTQRLVQLRNSAMLSYQEHQIPTSWMLDSGIISKIKKASVTLAKAYVKRVTIELESIQSSERESTQESLLLQGVHFAYRAHQFSGGLDSETLCAFEEIRRQFPGQLRGSPQLFAGIPSS